MKKQQKQKIFAMLLIIGIFLTLNQLGILSFVTQYTPWIDKEVSAQFDGQWDNEFPVTNAFDENFNTATAYQDSYKFGNIYETFQLPSDVDLDYLEFEMSYAIGLVPEVGEDVYAYVRYYVWNYETSSWEQFWLYSADTYGRPRIERIQVSSLQHIQNNRVKLRTNVFVGLLQGVFIFENQVRGAYSIELECEGEQTKCAGANNNEYFTCADNKWNNQGVNIGNCGVECINPSDCKGKSHIEVPGNWSCFENKCAWAGEYVPPQEEFEYWWVVIIGVIALGLILFYWRLLKK